ncbi:hypothetical protein HN51_009934 [Arachis hypogaea]
MELERSLEEAPKQPSLVAVPQRPATAAATASAQRRPCSPRIRLLFGQPLFELLSPLFSPLRRVFEPLFRGLSATVPPLSASIQPSPSRFKAPPFPCTQNAPS